MPQTTPERAARWPGGDSEAMDFLLAAGYKMTKQWAWLKPEGHKVTEKEEDALIYLIEEWDFAGLTNQDEMYRLKDSVHTPGQKEEPAL